MAAEQRAIDYWAWRRYFSVRKSSCSSFKSVIGAGSAAISFARELEEPRCAEVSPWPLAKGSRALELRAAAAFRPPETRALPSSFSFFIFIFFNLIIDRAGGYGSANVFFSFLSELKKQRLNLL